MPVLFDPTGQVSEQFGFDPNHHQLVLKKGGILHFMDFYRHDGVESAIGSLLTDD